MEIKMNKILKAVLWIVIFGGSLISIDKFFNLYNGEQGIYFLLGVISCVLVGLFFHFKRGNF